MFGGAERCPSCPFSRREEKTASVAKERLQIILAHERVGRNAAEPDYLPELQRELIAVIGKYIKIDPKDIKVNLERQDDLEVLEVKIELPEKADRPGKLSVQTG
ncbi:cell division topological specificity factor MinE [Ottowia pentelensis]|uniref:cell division topological specificity factor MinE n=1 Tax=Ottowia pentelensis TaxID=511108 RepID=UPI003631B032